MCSLRRSISGKFLFMKQSQIFPSKLSWTKTTCIKQKWEKQIIVAAAFVMLNIYLDKRRFSWQLKISESFFSPCERYLRVLNLVWLVALVVLCVAIYMPVITSATVMPCRFLNTVQTLTSAYVHTKYI